MIRDENAMLTGYVYLDLNGRDAEDYIAEAAGELRDAELLELCVRFMNSYLRATLNARDA